jgi:ABC-type dipeptide/oligopeptide/nickel transport system permease component
VLQAVNAQIKGGVRNMRTLMAVAPFAAISSSSVHTLMLITRAVSSFIKLYLLLLFMRVLLSWFPAFNWEDQPWLALRQVCCYMNATCTLLTPSAFRTFVRVCLNTPPWWLT